ncbi:MAG TPA: aldose 1-epimerase family protein [Gaiellaceae bacterium]|nr:aldose 1-epimerase family protein [Gaiellaceae bacterium]
MPAVPPSGAQVELASGDQRVVVTSVGAGLRTYSVAGRDVLDGYGEGELCPSGRGQLLVPWPNRIEDGSYELGGVRYQLPLDEPERRNAIHGLVRWSEWEVAEHEPARAVLEHVLHPTPGYPFTLALRVEYTLGGGLSARIEARNIGSEPCPYGAGQHPYLAVAGDRVDGVELHVPAASVLESDERGLPVGESPVAGELDFSEPRRIGSTALDHCFTGLERDSDGRARVRVGDTTLWLDESWPYVMAFTGDPLPDVARRSIAVEPMTCAPNAFNTGAGLIILEPGEMHSGSWGITP